MMKASDHDPDISQLGILTQIGKRLVRVLNGMVNMVVLVIFLLMFGFGCYAMWDSQQIYQAAAASQYQTYKPTSTDSLSFAELQQINSDVFAWINVYDTNIDYPVVQGESNDTYINTDVMGEYALSGSIFMDYQNSREFTDFNTIIYGHHMEKQSMFGEIENFRDKSYFDQRQYGDLYFDDTHHGLEFFAFLEVDAYDFSIYAPAVTGNARQSYLDNILAQATYTREIGVTTTDRIILLSTCAAQPTNGRHILVGRITDQTYENTLDGESLSGSERIDEQTVPVKLVRIPGWVWVIVWILLILLLLLFLNRKRLKKGGIDENKSKDQMS